RGGTGLRRGAAVQARPALRALRRAFGRRLRQVPREERLHLDRGRPRGPEGVPARRARLRHLPCRPARGPERREELPRVPRRRELEAYALTRAARINSAAYSIP